MLGTLRRDIPGPSTSTCSPSIFRFRGAATKNVADFRADCERAEARAATVAEIGVYRGQFAEQLLDGCPGISTYYMIDPWRNLADWNKPANKGDDVFERYYDETQMLAAYRGVYHRALEVPWQA